MAQFIESGGPHRMMDISLVLRGCEEKDAELLDMGDAVILA